MTIAQLPPAIFLLGPTASGKTALALALHGQLPVDIISVDAAQVYRGMDIGTAKPNPEELQRAPHRLIDIRDPAETYSAAEFRADALREMTEIVQNGRIPLLVGGTMFYFRALERGLAPLPSAHAGVRAALTEEAQRVGWPALHRRLAGADPETAARIDPHDSQRIQRALEILELTGEALSRINRRQPAVEFPFRPIKIALAPGDRASLHQRIAARFHTMLAQGLVAEVEGLHARGDLSLELPSMRTVGYRQVWRYLTKSINYIEMVEQAVAATRQLAKRQLTWLRADPQARWLESTDTQLVENSVRFVQHKLEQRDIISAQ